MGRAGRKYREAVREHWTDTHPDRHLWSPGRLAVARTQTQEEYEALYGRSDPGEARYLRSPLFPDPVPRHTLSRYDLWQKADKGAISKMSPEQLLRDPVFSFLGKQDASWIVTEEREVYRAAKEHRSEQILDLDLDPKRLQEVWATKTVEAASRGDALPLSPLAANLGKEIPWSEFTKRMRFWMKRDPEKARHLFHNNLWPEIHFLLENDDPDSRPERVRFFDTIYDQLRKETGAPENAVQAVIGYKFLYGHMLRAEQGSAFERAPLLQEKCGASEAVLRRFTVNSMDTNRPKELGNIEKAVFADQIARIIVCGGKEVTGTQENIFRDRLHSFANGENFNPLQNIEPLLGSGYKDLDQKMRDAPEDSFWRAEARRGKLLSHIYHALHRNPLDIDDFERQLHKTLCGVLYL